MSHVTCPKCKGTDHITGYGFAGGAFGGYTICECGVVLELSPDTEGLSDEDAARIERAAKERLAETWGDAA